MPKLIVTTPGFANQSCELPDGQFTVGRATRNLIVIDDTSVSSEHCQLLITGPEVVVRDVGSRNGTFVNETPVQSLSFARNGQCIRVGRVDLLVETAESKAPLAEAVSMYSRTAARPISSNIQFPIIFAPVSAAVTESESLAFPKAPLKDSAALPAEPVSARDGSARWTKYRMLMVILAGGMVFGLWAYFNWGL